MARLLNVSIVARIPSLQAIWLAAAHKACVIPLELKVMNRSNNSDRRQILKELRHQLRYTHTSEQRESIRQALDFWQRQR